MCGGTTLVMGIPASVLVHSIEPALPAPKRLFRLSNIFFEVVPHILFIAFII